MSHFQQTADHLKSKYFELRAMEKRSDEMLKQVIDTFYLMEGLSRLQADLDCLDVLIKNNTYLDRVLKFKIDNYKKKSSPKRKLKNLVNRSLKTITSSGLYKQIMKKESETNIESAFDQLKRITYTQQIKISELMEMVQGTIATNYEVLEQLQLISGMPTNNLARSMACTDLSQQQAEPRESNDSLNGEEQNECNDLDNLEEIDEVSDMHSSRSHESIVTLCKGAENISSTKTTQASNVPFCRPNRMFKKVSLENSGVCNKGFSQIESTVGDGQVVEQSETKESIGSLASKFKAYTLGPMKSHMTYVFKNQPKGDFVEKKTQDSMEISNETLKRIIDSENV